MAVVKQGASNVAGGLKLVWQGATVLKAWEDQIQRGMEDEAKEVLDALRTEIHELTGDMREKAFARVEVRGTKRTLIAGSDSEHAAFEELGTSARGGHPQIRKVMDAHMPHVTEKIRVARGQGR